MLKCKDVSRLIAADQLRTARFGTRLAVRAHLLMCTQCSRFAGEIREVSRTLRMLPPEQVTDDETKQAVIRIVRRLPMRRDT